MEAEKYLIDEFHKAGIFLPGETPRKEGEPLELFVIIAREVGEAYQIVATSPSEIKLNMFMQDYVEEHGYTARIMKFIPAL